MKTRILIVLSILSCSCISKTFSQSVSINTTGNAADTSAILDITSASKGILIPRMTSTQKLAIYQPADGLLIYQTDGVAGFYFYNSSISSWKLLAGVTGSAGITSLNGLTDANQTLAIPGTTGTAPNWVSGAATHTLNLPLASAAGVTAGLLSNADWNTFNNKQSALTTGNLTSADLTVTNGTGAVIGSGVSLNLNTSGVTAATYGSNTGTSYPIITVDSKGRITSATAGNIAFPSAITTLNGLTTAIQKFGTPGTSGTAPNWVSSNGFHYINIPLASASGVTAGLLSNADWNSFKTSTTDKWSLTGNAGTNSGTNFLGTTDNVSLRFQSFSTQGIILDSLGNVGIGSSPTFTAGVAREKFLVDAGSSTAPTPTGAFNIISGKGYLDSYLQLNVQNRAATALASSDIVASNDAATEAANFIDMGINSSGNTSTGVLGGVNTGYLYSTGSDFAIGNASANRSLNFFTGGTLATNERMRIDGLGNVGIGTQTPAYKLQVSATADPLSLLGVQTGTNTTTDSLLTITGGIVKKLPVGTFASASNAIASLNGLTATTQTFATPGTSGTAPAWNSTASSHTLNIPLASASGVTAGLLSNADYTIFNNKVSTTRTISTTLPLQGGGNLSANRTLSITDAGADGTTKGAATFAVADFDATAGLVTLDYANGQAASATNKGFLTAIDWNTFNNKASTSNVISSLNGLTATTQTFSTPGTTGLSPSWSSTGSAHTLNIPLASTSGVTAGLLSNADWNNFNNKASTANTWNIAGNTGTSSTNFIGTVDNTGFRIKGNSIQGLLVDSLGNVAVGATPTFSALSAREKFLVDAGTTNSINAISAKGSIDNYFQLNIQNRSASSQASSDIVATSDNGDESGGFVDLGINSSAYNAAAYNLGGFNDSYLYSMATAGGIGGNLSIGTGSTNKVIKFHTGGTTTANERMRIDGLGNVGIGTSNPTNKLQISSTANPLSLLGVQTGANTDSVLTITGGVVRKLLPSALTTTSSNAWALVGNTGSATTKLGTTNAFDLPIITNGATRMTVSSAGNVGIGSANFDATNPEKLLVDAGSTTSSTLINATGDNDGYLQLNVQNTNNGNYSSSDIVATASNGTDNSVYIDMGINSQGYQSGNNSLLNGANTAYLYASASDFYIGNGATNKPIIFFTNTGSLGGINPNGTEKMRIAANGQVSIGTSTANGTNKLTVSGSISASAFNVNSDKRLKTNIKDLHYGLKEILALQPVSYNWKKTPLKDKQLGLIAQDAKKVIPEVVSGNEKTGKLSINYTELIPVLINAIKEQQKEIEDLKETVKKLQK